MTAWEARCDPGTAALAVRGFPLRSYRFTRYPHDGNGPARLVRCASVATIAALSDVRKSVNIMLDQPTQTPRGCYEYG